MDVNQGKKLIQLARDSIIDFFNNKQTTTKEFPDKQGVFVTLKTQNGDLRGCIGYPVPIKPLGEAVIECARFSAFEDSRFEPLNKSELNNILIEISVLTKPELIKAKTKEELLKQIEIGKHGLSIDCDGYTGLLLPQVPIEQKWNKEEFLDNLCIKANLLPETWTEMQCKIYRFEAEIFSETIDSRIVKLK